MFILVPPLAESSLVVINDSKIFNLQLIEYIFFAIASILISLFIFKIINKKITPVSTQSNNYQISDGVLLFVACVGVTLFQYFIFESVDQLSILNIAIFSEAYRNGFYIGSGQYTLMLTLVLPTLLVINISFGINFRKIFYLCVLIILIATFLLGLRFYLIPIIIAYIYRITILRINYLKFIPLIILTTIILAFYKVYLSSQIENEILLIESILNPIIRLNYNAIVSHKFLVGIDNIYCVLPGMHYYDKCIGEEFKQTFLLYHSNITNGFPNLSKLSGVALPGAVYLYNIFGIFGVPIFATILVITYFFYYYSISNKINFRVKFFSLFTMIGLIEFMVEDVLWLQYLDLPFLILLCLIMIDVCIKKFKVINILKMADSSTKCNFE